MIVYTKEDCVTCGFWDHVFLKHRRQPQEANVGVWPRDMQGSGVPKNVKNCTV